MAFLRLRVVAACTVAAARGAAKASSLEAPVNFVAIFWLVFGKLTMTVELLLIFAATMIFLAMTPGPAVLVVVSQGMRYGARQSLQGTLGILTANAIYFALSAAGLGALLLASATLFQTLKWLGAGYLIFLGVKLLFAKSTAKASEKPASGTTEVERRICGRLFLQALITQLSNPKALVFFAALVPQFITTGDDVPLQFLVLGAISIAVEFPVLAAYGWLAERGRRLLPEGKLATLPDKIAGLFLIGTGISLATIHK